jgi:apolipoprotein N-acyltransferase
LAIFPTISQSQLVWLGLVPLLLATTYSGIVSAFLLSLITGMLFFLGIFSWIFEVAGYTALHHSLLAIYLGSYFAIFGWFYNFISTRSSNLTANIAAPFIWILLEYARSNMSFLALPWGLLAHSQYNNPLVLQVAGITGVYGISFLIVLVNAAS